jgi:mRNA interferase YafQ
MYLIRKTKVFEKSYKKLKASRKFAPAAVLSLEQAIDCLAEGRSIDQKFKDHALTGEYLGYRECHIKGDLLLIYRIEENKLLLVLVDIGSHSYLFG